MLRDRIKNNQLTFYFIFAYLISWSIALPLALSSRGLIKSIPLKLHYLSSFGPLIATLLILKLTERFKEFSKRIYNWQLGIMWWLVGLAPLILLAISFLILQYVLGTDLNLYLLGEVNFLGNLTLIGSLLFWTLTSGIGEEVGWRGFALPRLIEKYKPLNASLILGGLWFGWHIPYFFYLPGYQNFSFGTTIGFAIGILSGSVLLGWLYVRTQSFLLTIIWHGAFNFVTASKATEGFPVALISTAVICWAIVLLIFRKKWNASPS